MHDIVMGKGGLDGAVDNKSLSAG
jgi:ABC-type multidrug transport system fused ATPase/permease subunit